MFSSIANADPNGPAWVAGSDMNVDAPPDAPILVSPVNGAAVLTPAELRVQVSDPQASDMDVTFWGRRCAVGGEDFTLAVLPDTQYYSCGSGCPENGNPATFSAQTQWIVDHREALNIVAMTHLGDCVQNGDSVPQEWIRANAAISILETVLLPDGLPYGICVGNHDQTPNGDAAGSTAFYNQYFGISRFQGRGYYGGHYGTNNDNHYTLFSGGGMDFILIDFEYDTAPDAEVLDWADALLKTYSDRRAILSSHYLLDAGNPGAFGQQGQTTYNALKDNPNLFLMLCGHRHGEGMRVDSFNGNTVFALLSDYQALPKGGNGWLRYMTFSPANDTITVTTYSPTLDQYGSDTVMELDSTAAPFVLNYDMGPGSGPFTKIATVNGASSGSEVSTTWNGLTAGRCYEWRATASTPGGGTTTSETWSFDTTCASSLECDDGDACTEDACVSTTCEHASIPGCCSRPHDSDCDDILNSVDNCVNDANTSQEDGDGDAVGDACDDCPGTLSGLPVDGAGCPLPPPADFDRDGDVDLVDFAHLQACFGGPGHPPGGANCQDADLQKDSGDVDLNDYLIFQRCLTGEGIQADPACGR